jgi:hypothetical protein
MRCEYTFEQDFLTCFSSPCNEIAMLWLILALLGQKCESEKFIEFNGFSNISYTQ